VVSHDARLFRFADNILHVEDGSGQRFADPEVESDALAQLSVGSSDVVNA
jgi:hypothetical protein